MIRYRLAAIAGLAGIAVACSSGSGGTATPSPSPTPTPAPTPTAAASGGGAQASFSAGTVAELEALIPGQVGTLTLQKQSARASDFFKSSSMDAAQQKEIQDFIAKTGANPADVTIAFGFGFSAANSGGLTVFAFRAPGADQAKMVAYFQESMGKSSSSPLQWKQASVGGKSVYSATESSNTTYLYSKNDILFMVAGTPDTLVQEALGKLP